MKPTREPRIVLGVHAMQDPANAEKCIGRLTAEFVPALVKRQPQIVAAVSIDSRLPPPAFLEALRDQVLVTDLDEPPPVSPDEQLLFHAFSDLDLPLQRIWPKWAQAPAVGLVVTTQDMASLTQPDSYRDGTLRRLQDSRCTMVEEADALIVNSHATANDVTGRLCVDPLRVFVATCGVSDRYAPHPLGRPEALRLLPGNLGLEGDFLLSTCDVDSSNTFRALIRAYASLSKEVADQHQLVVTTPRLDSEQSAALRLEVSAQGVASRVTMMSDVDDATMLLLYQACHAFVSPSLHDCLGRSVIKAMRCGAPSIVSDIELLREIVSDPAARFDPGHEVGMAAAVHRVLTDEQFVESRREAGLRDAARYSWDAWEQSVLTAYDGAARRRP